MGRFLGRPPLRGLRSLVKRKGFPVSEMLGLAKKDSKPILRFPGQFQQSLERADSLDH